MAILDMQALVLSSELNGGYDDCYDHCYDDCGSDISLLLCS